MTDLITPSRRGVLLGFGTIIAAPAIVRIENLMPVKLIIPPRIILESGGTWVEVNGAGETIMVWTGNQALNVGAFVEDAQRTLIDDPSQFDKTYIGYNRARWLRA